MKHNLTTKLFAGLLLLFCVAFTWFALQKPSLNWDMIGYVASARDYETSDSRLLQQEVYELLSRSVSEEKYTELTSGHLRQIRATDPESLHQHLPFYQIRPMYVWSILALWKMGMNPYVASYVISAVCAAFAIWILAFLLPGKPRSIYLLFVPGIALASGFLDLARYSTPDALGVFAVSACYWLMFRRHKFLLIALPTCILIRTDLLVLMPFFYIYLWIIKPFDRRVVAASGLLCIALYVGTNAYFGNYGWATVFDYTFLNHSTHPADFPHAVTLASYLAVVKSGIMSSLGESQFLTYIVMTFAGLVSLFRQRNWDRPSVSPLQMDMTFAFFSMLAYVGLHFLLFPILCTRFFAGQYALAMALTMYQLLDAAWSN